MEAVDITQLREAEDRVHPRFANLLYEIGENHMGGLTFQLTFTDGKVADYGFGSGLFRDFLEFPIGYSAREILELDFLSRRKSDFPREFGVREDYLFCFVPDNQIMHQARTHPYEGTRSMGRRRELEETFWN